MLECCDAVFERRGVRELRVGQVFKCEVQKNCPGCDFD